MLIDTIKQDLEIAIDKVYQELNSEDLVAIISQIITDEICHSHYYLMSDYSLKMNVFIIVASFTCLTQNHYVPKYFKNFMINLWKNIQQLSKLMKFSNVYTNGLR